MEDMIFALLEQSKQSLKIYEEMQKKLTKSVMMSSSGRMKDQIIADNCIQMAAVNWCKVFASKKSKTHYSAVKGLDKKLFISFIEARDILFQDVCDKMRSFRDKYAEGMYSPEEIAEMFKQAVGVEDAFEHVAGRRD